MKPNLKILLCGSLVWMAAFSAFAFRNDEPPGKAPPAGPLSVTPPVRQAAAGQLAAAKQAEAAGFRVEWQRRLGTPLSIRGADLGVRGTYSGGKGLVVSPAAGFESNAVAVLDNLAPLYQFRDAANEFAARPAEPDTLGFHHVRLEQRYQGLRVFGGQLIVHFNRAGQAYQVNGEYVADINVALVPKLAKEQAVPLAQADLAAMSRPTGRLTRGPELVVFARNVAPQLAYELTLSYEDSKDGPGQWRYWIGALTGEVLLRYDDIQKIAPPTANGNHTSITGNILSGEGGQSITLTAWYEYTGYYYLYNTNQVWLIYNVATNLYPDYGTYAFRTTPAWGTSDRAEISAAQNFDIVQRYYHQVHGRNSYNDLGFVARVNVHQGYHYVNAFWEPSLNQMFIGDGDNYEASPLGVLDVCGHEFSHGVDQYSANLTYAGESGALNESFSDILGACIEFFGQTDGRGAYPGKTAGTADWLMGEDCWLSSTALRDMRNPRNTATVGSGNEQPSKYYGTYWYTGTGDNGGVHQNSGPQNFCFYLICEGGSGFNDGIPYSVTGIGIQNAEKIAYRALTVYCTAGTDYHGARTAWISAAEDLDATWVSTVDAAWSAIGIAPPAPRFVYFPLDTDPGWARQGQWGFGQPTGGGSSPHDPTSGHTGLNVFGYNLGGDYPNNMATTYYLTTSALDCSAYTNVALAFWRRLGVESSSWDHANIQVSSNGVNWVTVWANSGTVADTDWVQVTYNISAVADLRPTVYVRWGMGPTDSSYTYPGWNIDDIELQGWPFNTTPTPPTIIVQPQSQSVMVGSNATFSVGANGSTPLQYFWRRDGALMPGATRTSYILTNAQLSDSGAQFSCLVSNAVGTALSSAATLSVVPGEVTHFHWTAIGTPQLVNVPFTVSLTARNAADAVVSTFAGPVNFAAGMGGGSMIEDFETGGWPKAPWVVSAGGVLSPAYAHDGSYGLSDPGWAYRTDVSLGNPGDSLSWWVRPTSSTAGRAYLGFGASASGCWSLVAAPNSGELLLQLNSPYASYTVVAEAPQAWVAGKWYKAAVEFSSGGTVTGKLYDSDGTTLLNSVTYTGVTGLPGGVAIRSFGDFALDTIAAGQGAAVPVNISPETSGAFVGGTWTGDITVLEPGTNIIIAAVDGAGHGGQSNPFDVLPFTGGLSALINFDDVPGPGNVPLPAGYHGLNWSNFNYVDAHTYPTSGFMAGMVSANNVAYNAWGAPATLANPVPFNFLSAYLTAAWNDNLLLEARGYAGETLAYDQVVTLSATAPSLLTFNYLGITRVDFISWGGTQHPGYPGSGTQFVIDNVLVATTEAGPLPELQLVRAAGQWRLSWPASALGFVPERATAVRPGASWSRVPGDIITEGNRFVLIVPEQPGAAFYRLHRL